MSLTITQGSSHNSVVREIHSFFLPTYDNRGYFTHMIMKDISYIITLLTKEHIIL